MNTHFWKNKKVLITGHTGFKGSWLSLWLQNLGSKVVGYSDSIPTNPSLFETAKVEMEMDSIFGDIIDKQHIQEVMENFKPEIVFHMAAQSLVRRSYEQPLITYETNVMGTANLLESARKTRPKVIVVITSDKCYNNKETNKKFIESDPMGGYDPYSSSKGCAELVVSSFRNSFFNINKFENHSVSLSTVRAGNVIGGGDWAEDRLIPDIIKCFLKNEKLHVRNPNATRPWQFVLDPLYGYLILAEKMWNEGKKFSQAWNFGPDEKNLKSVSWIIEKFENYLNKKFQSDVREDNSMHEASTLTLDSTKANKELGWNIKIDINKALEWTVNWYTNYNKKNDMRKFSMDQITTYQAILR